MKKAQARTGINKEKTKVFKVGTHTCDESQEFKNKIRDRVTDLGAIFFKNKQEENFENLIKPTEKLYEF